MFRLIKIENSGVNVPEPIKIKKEMGSEITAGEALVAASGNVEPCPITEKPTYIALGNADMYDEYAYCYRVHPHMLFEVEISKTPDALFVGNRVKLAANDNGAITMVSSDLGGPAEILEIESNCKAGDRITVKF